ncbi:hypothetical protein SETIT_6G071700v2 [Setaria italica]|uniref:Uncharacterized protein n=2 Tax=Setaria italica TaxID=4555 RepID=A0A368RJ34_SETIT|nr:hypothetical protein SETIT_6G071700v2 [Setaria italica]
MASIGWVLLLFLAQLHTLLSTSIAHRADGGNLTHLPVSFLSTTRLSSWRNGTDCCLWEGVGCDPSSGHVTILDLNNRCLSSHGLDPALFSLISLRRLDLSMNDIGGDNIRSAGFERFTFLTHLNLSNSGLYGQIPPSISKLVNLLSLDLSTYNIDYSLGFYGPNYYDYYNYLWESSFDTFVVNLSNLRELYLDSVDLSNSGEEWGTSLAAYVPQLQVLSLADCHLSGPIHKALSRLHSLVVIKLQENFYEPSGRPFPEFFMDFPNLTVLQLSQTDLEGPLPSRPFQSKNLRVLDLSYNMNLSGHVPNFSNASSLETLRLDGTNLVYDIPTPSSNFTSLKELGLKRNLISMDFLSAFGRLESLHQLDLDCFLDNELDHDLDSGSDLGPIFSWIGQHKNLTSLGLFGCNFSGVPPTLLSNFMNLKNLKIQDCNLPRPVLHAVGNLTGLQTLAMDDCTTYGSMPSSIGNLTNLRNLHILSTFSGPMPAAIGGLTNLRNLYIKDVGFSGPMPAAIGELTNLRNLYIEDVGFSGPMPPAIGKLTNLRNMYIEHSGFSVSCGFSGPMPAAIGELTNLVLRVCNFSGSVPSSIVNLTQLTMLDLSFNSLNGEIPPSIFSLPILTHLDLSFNQLSGPIHGHVSPSICNATELDALDLSYNYLNGPIPPCFIENIHLRVLNLRQNRLQRMLPSNITTRCHLQTIDLHGNKIEGRLPRGLSNCTDLEVIDFGSNKIADAFPWLRGLPKLFVLVLRSNQMYGTIGDIVGDTKCEECFPSLQIIDLASNNFSGTLRPQWFKQLKSMMAEFNSSGKTLETLNTLHGEERFYQYSIEIMYKGEDMRFGMTTVTAIDFSKNSLEGTIPETFGSLVSLRVLNLSHNAFTGKIPAQLRSND